MAFHFYQSNELIYFSVFTLSGKNGLLSFQLFCLAFVNFLCLIVVKNLVYKSHQQARENELRQVIRFYPQPSHFTGHDVAVVVDIVTLKTKASICRNPGICLKF